MDVPRSLKAIKFAWVAVVLLFEVVIFIDASARCQWPDPGGKEKATHVLIVADPQILNEGSYPERSSLLRTISRIFVDMNMRKAWRVAKSKHPDAVIFLGDMMDNGFADMRFIKYQEYVARFQSIFSAPSSLPVYYVPGNHDVGLENSPNTSPIARPRYKTTFGPLSQHVVLGGHSLIMVDAPALVEEDWRRDGTGENRANGLPRDLEYLRHMRAEHAVDLPLILFTHIPLYRVPGSNCGPRCEKGPIPAVRGDGYQTLLTPETTQLLLNELRPTLVFSGDHHDYCEYTHIFHQQSIPEVTVKSFSIAMGIRQPAFHLLSLSSEARTNAHRMCSLPNQLRVYFWVYIPLLLATIVFLAARAAGSASSRHQRYPAKRSVELPEYRERPPPGHPRSRSYPMRVAEDMWTVAWPPLALYVVIAITAFW